MAGKIIGIYTAEKDSRPVGHRSVSVVANQGIVGDRYYKGQGTFSEMLKQKRKREITFIAAEEIDRFNETQNADLEYGDLRRNVVTRGVDLNALVGRRFSIAGVRFEGLETCEPCAHLARTVHPDVLPHLVNRAGLRAAVLTSGDLAVGNEIRD